ncbi:AbrB/MazE/SpoVT family DNA-binding domain-containing protein [Bradyrhizobium manausense]|uniref:AbrB/MazE/SpoVT family DNA-binding domain-containing protein n=1 Tax=Bradyrhizobium manausense TaxID=989370 RepID=UPI001BAC0E06|nr:AbrB/MazE/SpoVT family DNA-binding domain-containing protein [Bradyrhizobium manausense]MBR1092466.1 AbrB/MazE/SpoVT family DNA-binding domain-containing protein [Bradyrhizobium manausense]
MTAVLKVFKWDDDLAVELPQELVDQFALKEGDELEILADPALEAGLETKETPDTEM